MSDQRSLQWFKDRFGMITMSDRIEVLMTGHVLALNNLLRTLWAERETPEHRIVQAYEESMETGDRVHQLRWGRRYEEESREFYEMTRNVDVEVPGFKRHPAWPDLIGDSSDFLEGEDWVGEIKCYTDPLNHQVTLRDGMHPKHTHQVQGHMECHRRPRARFCSYDPRVMVDSKKLYVENVEWDDDWHKLFEERAAAFHDHFTRGTLFDFAMNRQVDGIPTIF